MYKPIHFAIHELVPPAVFKERGEKAWELLDDRLLITIDRLRDRYGPMTINNYEWGGPREWSGLRTPDSPYYRVLSQHTYGRAADCQPKNVTVEEIQRDIQAFPNHRAFELINSMELGTLEPEPWLHIDVRNCDRIMTYYPR